MMQEYVFSDRAMPLSGKETKPESGNREDTGVLIFSEVVPLAQISQSIRTQLSLLLPGI